MKTLVGFVALVLTGSALACSCGPWGNGKLLVKESAAAFIGFPNMDSAVVGTEDGEVVQRTSFVVLRNFKAARFSRTMNVFSIQDTGANCGASFTNMSGVFLIFADQINGRLVTNSCMLSEADSKRALKAMSEITF